MPLITSANAREMAAKSAAMRQAIGEAFRASRSAEQATAPLPANPIINVDNVRSRLETLDQLMSKAKTDREWDNLSRAYERLFKVYVHLAGLPGPGQRKPAPERAPKRSVNSLSPIPEHQPTILPLPIRPPSTADGPA